MRYTTSAYDKASDELSQRRRQAEELHRRRIAEVESKCPEIIRVNNKLANVKSELYNAINSGTEGLSERIEKIRKENLKAQETLKEFLKAYDYAENYLSVPYTCNKCDDTGFKDGIRCECFEDLLRKYSVNELRDTCRVKLNDFSEFDLSFYSEHGSGRKSERDIMSNVLSYCKEYAKKFDKTSDSLLLIGNTGLGKTLLSSAIAQEVINSGFSVAYDSISNFLRIIEDEHFGRSQGSTMELLLSADLVILDDLGSEFSTPFNASTLYEIINSRINYGLPTIVSTNFSMKELNEHYNERIFSRLTGLFIPVQFVGKDIRLQKKMKK